jgi:hypothetical protein
VRAGGFAFPIIDAAITTTRSTGSLGRALAELSRRDEQVHHLSLRRLQASATLHAYLAKHYFLVTYAKVAHVRRSTPQARGSVGQIGGIDERRGG